jgi:hypothetical protein
MRKERLAWIVALVVVAAWGGLRTPVLISHDETAASPHMPLSRLTSIQAGKSSRSRPLARTERSAIVAERAGQALRNPDPLARMTDFLSVLSSCDASSIERIAEKIEEMQAAGISLGPEAELVNYRAGQLKGGELLSGRTGLAMDFAVIGSLRKQFEGWLQSAPEDARGWLDQLPPGRFRDEMAVVGITAIVKNDPASALQLASTLSPAQQTAAGRVAAEELARSAPATEIATLLEATPADNHTHYLTSLVDTLINSAEGDIVVDSLPDDLLARPYVSGSTLLRASAARAKLDPVGALDWAASMEGKKDDLAPGAILSAAVHGMSQEDLTRAEQWASAHPDATGLAAAIAEYRSLLENRGNDTAEYDRHD